jgi:uncharacterized membrane protein YjgN (DUF898 family)
MPEASRQVPEPLLGEPGAADGPAAGRELALQFRGSAREYFRVWAVNLCLTLLTFGLFSAWAKVRKKRYFYAHTTLDGTPFQYLAQPLPILKGRVIAAVLFVVYYLSSHYFTSVMPYVLAAGAALAPWVIVRSAAFNARYSAFRNMTFEFDAGYVDGAKTIYAFGIVPVLVAGSIFNWWGEPRLALAAFGVFGLAFPWWIRRLKHFLVNRMRFGGENGELSVTGGQFFKVYFKAGLIMIAAAFATGLLVAGAASVARQNPYAFMLAMLPGYAGYVFAFAFVQAHLANLVWNHTRIGPLRFQSHLKGRSLAKLYVTNALGILASLGLLIPWAVVRTLKYRVDHTKVLLEGELDTFHSEGAGAVRAAGAEVGEFFDLDLSL